MRNPQCHCTPYLMLLTPPLLVISSGPINAINVLTPLKCTSPDLTSPQISTLIYPMACLTLPRQYLKSISNFTCPKLNSGFSPHTSTPTFSFRSLAHFHKWMLQSPNCVDERPQSLLSLTPHIQLIGKPYSLYL